jgi:hypothetical protein
MTKRGNMLLHMKIHFMVYIQDDLIVVHIVQAIYRLILSW